MRPAYRFVFMVGHSHCGSTLLGRMLNMHPDVFCPGEVLRIDDSFRTGYPCSCDATLDQCPFWTPRLHLVSEPAQRDYRNTTREDYNRILEHEQKRLLLDISKSKVYRMRRRLLDDQDAGLIFLVRDTRGVMASILRRGNTFDHELRSYVKWLKRFARMERALAGRALRVYYEDIAADPASALRTVCDFLGIDPVDDMLCPSRTEHHFIHASISPYTKTSDAIECDERWRAELRRDEIDRIERVMAKWPLLRDRYLAG